MTQKDSIALAIEALEGFLECPYDFDAATISKGGLEATMQANPSQVVVNMSVAYIRIRNARAALAALRAQPAKPNVTVIAESLYERTGDIKDFNIMLIGRDVLQEFEEMLAAPPGQEQPDHSELVKKLRSLQENYTSGVFQQTIKQAADALEGKS